ncbi:MAG: Abi family protein [Fusobacteriaceae bacterium]|nr:Abi family protein [Fusobacteriaceae bacterium]MBP6467086.1 Abi family protein [Fusobacteriaceae bacterium]MBP9595705.1 Abi family protein [Fusobacteriaceae bacterium]MBU9917471.1 Abi family protein [Fusobacteriaceae bacterium]
MKYSKEHKSFKSQIEILRERGIVISNEDKLVNFLSNVNYYKFKNYLKYFEIGKDLYKNCDVEEVIDLYYFDRELRNIILLYLEKIEISIKTKIAYIISGKYGAFGHLDKSNFYEIFNFDDYIKRISILERSSKEEFVKHYFSIYEEENHVPIWILIEIIPFGNISKMYEYMLNDDKKEVSKKFDVSKPDFESWLENITLLRNFCAHNSIIWNKKINSVARKSKKWKQNIKWDKISGMIFLLNYLVKQINPQFSSERLYTLLSDFHENHNAKFKELGFQEKNDIRFLKDIS